MFIFVNVLIICENSIILMTEYGSYTCTNPNIIGNSVMGGGGRGLENKKNKLRNILTSTQEFINTLHAN
jgi:hypothetical protein